MNVDFKFKKAFSFEIRQSRAEEQIREHPDKVPVIVERAPNTRYRDLENCRHIVPADATLGQLNFQLRNHLRLRNDQALFLFINNEASPSSFSLGYLWHNFQDKDKFLYIAYADENVYGPLDKKEKKPKVAVQK